MEQSTTLDTHNSKSHTIAVMVFIVLVHLVFFALPLVAVTWAVMWYIILLSEIIFATNTTFIGERSVRFITLVSTMWLFLYALFSLMLYVLS